MGSRSTNRDPSGMRSPAAEEIGAEERTIPVVLQIVTPVGTEFVKDCAGTYYLQDDTVNGYPLWMKEGPKDEFTARYLYFADGRYHVGGQVQRRKNFLDTRGYIQGPRILPSSVDDDD